MIKSIIKEIIIILLLLLAIILALGVIFYNYIPTNKTVPSVKTYSTPETIKNELDEQIKDEDSVIVTYEITGSDLNTYVKTNQYKKGKANPFSPYENDILNENTVSSTNTNVQSSNTKGNTYYPNKGTK